MNEWDLLIGPGNSQSEHCHESQVEAICTWHFTCLSAEPESHYLSNTIHSWGSDCSSECLSSVRQSQGAMAVANFQYITRMSSGFKVYILEGELVEHFPFISFCCFIFKNTFILYETIYMNSLFISAISVDMCLFHNVTKYSNCFILLNGFARQWCFCKQWLIRK